MRQSKSEDIAPDDYWAVGPGVEVLDSLKKETLFICHMAMGES
jgi:hypothetical protein